MNEPRSSDQAGHSPEASANPEERGEQSYAAATSAQRDAGMLLMMGGFFFVFGLLVWIGMFWDRGLAERVVSTAAGAILVVLGGLTIWYALRLRRRAR